MKLLADELDHLGVLKRKAERVGRYKKDRDEVFKTHQVECLDLMEAQKSKSHRGEDGTLYTRVDDRVKGQVEDRRTYVRWALEQDEAVQEFLEATIAKLRPQTVSGLSAWVASFYDAVMNTELVKFQADQGHANALARAHVDDEAVLPPGLTFRPDPYVQMRRS